MIIYIINYHNSMSFCSNRTPLCLTLVLCLVLSFSCFVQSKGSLQTLDEETWRDLLTGEWMVEFYAPWCPACKALEKEWKSFASWSDDIGVKIADVDVTANPGLSGRFMVTALPTIYHVKEGVFRQYKGGRDANTFVSFIEEKKWQSLDVVPSWKAPDSILMSIVSYFFKISMALRAIHNKLVEDYGIPYWGSYILFAFATILLGAILGLLIVCVIDLIFPVKSLDDKRNAQNDINTSGDSAGDLIEEDNDDDDEGEEEEESGSEEEADKDANKDLRRRLVGSGKNE